MRTTGARYSGMLAVGVAVLLAAGQARLNAQQAADEAIRIGNIDAVPRGIESPAAQLRQQESGVSVTIGENQDVQ